MANAALMNEAMKLPNVITVYSNIIFYQEGDKEYLAEWLLGQALANPRDQTPCRQISLNAGSLHFANTNLACTVVDTRTGNVTVQGRGGRIAL